MVERLVTGFMNVIESAVDISPIQRSNVSPDFLRRHLHPCLLSHKCVCALCLHVSSNTNAFLLTHSHTQTHWSIPLVISAECEWRDWHLECDSAVCPGLVWCCGCAHSLRMHNISFVQKKKMLPSSFRITSRPRAGENAASVNFNHTCFGMMQTRLRYFFKLLENRTGFSQFCPVRLNISHFELLAFTLWKMNDM